MLPSLSCRTEKLKRTLFARQMTRGMSLLLLSPLVTQSVFAQSVISALEQEIGDLVHAAKPSVVTVLAMKRSSRNTEGKGLFGFFGDQQEAEKEFKAATGIIISSDGFVLTKESVLRDVGIIDVALDNGSSYRAEWVERDSLRGVALIKIPASDLTPAHFSMTEKLRAGSWITVIGNSLGVSHAVSVGVVSGIQPDGVVQISANVDPGCNGSPVFDAHAHVIGMVMGRMELETSEPRKSSFFSNTALVHPFEDLLPFLRSAVERYYAQHGWIGVTVVTDASWPSPPRILKLIENGPGHKSGLQVGDTITHFDGKEVDSPSTLGELVNQVRPGATVSVKVNRMGQELALEVRIAPKTPIALAELNFESDTSHAATQSSSPKSLKRIEGRTEPQWMLQRRLDALEKEIKALQSYYKRN